MNLSIIGKTDSYKLGHHDQYPKDTEKITSYFESRVGAKYPSTVFFGLQYIMKKHLLNRVTKEDVETEAAFSRLHFGFDDIFNYDGWMYIVNKHNGRLPIHIKAVPEGLAIPTSNVLMTVEATDPKSAWLVSPLETLLVQSWYPSTVATVSYYVKKSMRKFLAKTSDNPEAVDFMLVDFGVRGCKTMEDAGIGGLGHLINYQATDNIPAIKKGIKYYNSGVCGYSVFAAEHSTITSWGKDKELEAYENILNLRPKGIVAFPIDSYDMWNAIQMIGTKLKDKILARDGKTVLRPDSGNPVTTPVGVVSALYSLFGGTINSKGYKVLNPKVGCLQGDGMTPETIDECMELLVKEGFSVENIVFGMGGGLLQKLDRDTQRFAFKCSEITIDGVARDVFKQPKTDLTKASKKGRLKLIQCADRGIITVPQSEPGKDILQTVFLDGEIKRLYTFDDVKQHAEIGSGMGRVLEA